jgi:hypothetical protein
MPGVKKSNPKKGHPKCDALRAAPSETVREGRAFRQGSCPGEKELASMPIPLRAFSSPSHSPHKGTHARVERTLEGARSKEQQQKQKQTDRGFTSICLSPCVPRAIWHTSEIHRRRQAHLR